jgi:predicted unusual protein kinase regulating ubiquinone biosynthesis (AarF/ABC1/UbiB family)
MKEAVMKPSSLMTAAVPGGRWSRLARLGSLAGGVAGGMIAEGARQLAQGKRPALGDLILTPGNARRVADQLAQLRGAAMKVGQLLSMDAGDLLPGELQEILSRLRSEAKAMPMSQLVAVLERSWGAGWDRHFERFSFTPLAAASIGQVHAARTRDGRQLAIKVQYPGIRQSIDSDVDNVATLMRLSGLLPKTFDIDPLLVEAKRQLHAEADYLSEGGWLQHYARLLADSPDFLLPGVHEDFTTENILAMCFVDGVAIESLVSAPATERDRVVGLLFSLLFREIFEFQVIQTDPNFANYRYQPASGKIVLLDFGATRAYAPETVVAYRRLMAGAMAGDRSSVDHAAAAIGYFQADIQDRHRQAVIDIFMLAAEPLRHTGAYDFGQSTLATRIRDAGLVLGMDRDCWHTPPVDALFLHRKLGGLYRKRSTLPHRSAGCP